MRAEVLAAIPRIRRLDRNWGKGVIAERIRAPTGRHAAGRSVAGFLVGSPFGNVRYAGMSRTVGRRGNGRACVLKANVRGSSYAGCGYCSTSVFALRFPNIGLALVSVSLCAITIQMFSSFDRAPNAILLVRQLCLQPVVLLLERLVLENITGRGRPSYCVKSMR